MAGRRSPVRYAIKRDQIYRSIEREAARERELLIAKATAALHETAPQAPRGSEAPRATVED